MRPIFGIKVQTDKSGFDIEKEGYSNINKKDESRIKKSKTKEKTMLKISFIYIRWNQNRETSFCEKILKKIKFFFLKVAKISLRFWEKNIKN